MDRTKSRVNMRLSKVRMNNTQRKERLNTHNDMAGRLSELQKNILQIAYKSHRLRPEYKIDTSIREVLIKVYGFPSDFDITRKKNPPLIFKREAIGTKRYQSAYAAISRCFERLVTRGLVKKGHGQGFTCGYGAGIKLTNKAILLAEDIRQLKFLSPSRLRQ